MCAASSALLLQGVHDAGYSRIPAAVLDLPRRRPHPQREQAQRIASILFPEYSVEKALIHYEDRRKFAVATHRAAVNAAKVAQEQLRQDMNRPDKQRKPWDPETDPVELPKALPMPVEIGDEGDFKDCFAFLKADHGGRVEALLNMPDLSSLALSIDIMRGEEPIYKSRLLEFKRGVVYENGRLDLCKMIVGPDHIDALMDALEHNRHVRHFLLGNNVITNHGARRIARFVTEHPERMRTWYLAGNHIKPAGFRELAQALEGSTVLEQLWVKRNPLGAESVDSLVKVIGTADKLQVLDIETCELGDEGIEQLFTGMLNKPNSLETVYVNGNGVGTKASAAIAKFLGSSTCRIKYLMMSSNPLGDAGATKLASGILKNTTLEVVTMASCGMSGQGVSTLCRALASHPKIRYLDLGSRFTTVDLGQRFNYISEDAVESINALISKTSLQFLHLGYVALSASGLEQVRDAVASSPSLVGFTAIRIVLEEEGADQTGGHTCSLRVSQALEANYLRNHAGKGQIMEGVPYEHFISMSGPSRLLRNSPGVRLIDSVYRTRDKWNLAAGKARKYWDLEQNERERELWERLDGIE